MKLSNSMILILMVNFIYFATSAQESDSYETPTFIEKLCGHHTFSKYPHLAEFGDSLKSNLGDIRVIGTYETIPNRYDICLCEFGVIVKDSNELCWNVSLKGYYNPRLKNDFGVSSCVVLPLQYEIRKQNSDFDDFAIKYRPLDCMSIRMTSYYESCDYEQVDELEEIFRLLPLHLTPELIIKMKEDLLAERRCKMEPWVWLLEFHGGRYGGDYGLIRSEWAATVNDDLLTFFRYQWRMFPSDSGWVVIFARQKDYMINTGIYEGRQEQLELTVLEYNNDTLFISNKYHLPTKIDPINHLSTDTPDSIKNNWYLYYNTYNNISEVMMGVDYVVESVDSTYNKWLLNNGLSYTWDSKEFQRRSIPIQRKN